MKRSSDDPGSSTITNKMNELMQEAARAGLSLHILGDGTIISIPKQNEASPSSAPDNQSREEEGEQEILLEGSEALDNFMNPDNSDCPIASGSTKFHAKRGEYYDE